jgi:polyisoprenoid-binding protein YceI
MASRRFAASSSRWRTPIPQLKDHLLSADFFDAAEHPSITFRSTDIRIGEDGSATVEGELTMRGVTKAVTANGAYGTATGLSGGEVVGFDLQATVDRRDYGLDWQAPLPSGGDALAWDVSIQIQLELTKA